MVKESTIAPVAAGSGRPAGIAPPTKAASVLLPSDQLKMKKKPTPRTNRSSSTDRKRGREEKASTGLGNARPKRRAASSVRFGSYRDTDNVDFSLLENFHFDETHLAKTKRSSLSSAKKVSAPLKRSALLASSSTKAAASSTGPSNKRKSIDIPMNALMRQKKGVTLSGAALENLLPPVLLSRTQDGGDFTPQVLRHLSSTDGKLDIFNRKTGRIMKGEDGISVKELTAALRKHSEYEPIIPRLPSSSAKKESARYRQARTSATARVSETVVPQNMIRESNVAGRTVLIVGGPHKGLFGKIDACIPGNWYVLSDVLKDDSVDLDMVVHSKHLKLVGTRPRLDESKSAETKDGISSTNANNQKEQKSDDYDVPVTHTIESLRLRIEALEEQKWKVQGLSAAATGVLVPGSKVGPDGIVNDCDRDGTMSFQGVPKDIASIRAMERKEGKDNSSDRSVLERELRRITMRIVEAKSEMQRYKLVRNLLVGRGLNGDASHPAGIYKSSSVEGSMH